MNEIKKIYCFGTSFTEGGGFEFEQNSKLYELYGSLGEEMTKANFSYPGQLQKLLSNIEVINLAKSGYGNEAIYRLATDLTLSDNFKKDETLFIFEFSYLGRKEYYSRSLQDYIIVNYNYPEISCKRYARNYNQTKEISEYETSQLPDGNFFDKFLKSTIDTNIQHNLVVRNTTMFLSFLKQYKINYLFSSNPNYINPLNFDKLIHGNAIKHINNSDLHADLEIYEGTIRSETKNIINDNHYGLISNKLIASKIYDELVDRQYIIGDILNKSRKDFNHIQYELNKYSII